MANERELSKDYRLIIPKWNSEKKNQNQAKEMTERTANKFNNISFH
jgi:hypothetical protein